MTDEVDNSSIRESVEQMDAHIQVVDLDNPIPPNAPKGSKATGPLSGLVPPVPKEVQPITPTKPDVAQT